MKNVFIPIHKFSSCMGYCQYQVINHFHLKIKPETTKAQILGKKIHDQLEEKDKLIPRKEATEKELKDKKTDLDIPRESIKVNIIRKNLNNFIYLGRIDKLIRQNKDIYIIDDKTTTKKHGAPTHIESNSLSLSRMIPTNSVQAGEIKLWPDRKLQLSAYCEGFKQNYAKEIAFRKIYFKIIQRDKSGNVIGERTEKYDKYFKEFLTENFELFENIYNKKIEPEHHYNSNKCRACKYECQFKIQ